MRFESRLGLDKKGEFYTWFSDYFSDGLELRELYVEQNYYDVIVVFKVIEIIPRIGRSWKKLAENLRGHFNSS